MSVNVCAWQYPFLISVVVVCLRLLIIYIFVHSLHNLLYGTLVFLGLAH
jgi:hypothetical protein